MSLTLPHTHLARIVLHWSGPSPVHVSPKQGNVPRGRMLLGQFDAAPHIIYVCRCINRGACILPSSSAM